MISRRFLVFYYTTMSVARVYSILNDLMGTSLSDESRDKSGERIGFHSHIEENVETAKHIAEFVVS